MTCLRLVHHSHAPVYAGDYVSLSIPWQAILRNLKMSSANNIG